MPIYGNLVHKYKYIICSFLIDIEYLSFKRNNKIKDYFHKSTRYESISFGTLQYRYNRLQ